MAKCYDKHQWIKLITNNIINNLLKNSSLKNLFPNISKQQSCLIKEIDIAEIIIATIINFGHF
ncbi:MAG TPA: hypothetical protein VN958_15495 [Chitinophagaceae bacterium]|nr:hypothetical protein [Chitinophagaceae bacterium]